MKKFIHIIGWIVIFGNLVLIGLVAFWLLYPYKVPTVKEPIPIENTNKTIAIGEQIKMQLDINKPSDVSPVLSQHNITCDDGNLVTLSSTSKTLQKGTYTMHSNGYTLPPKVAKGSTCQFNFINTYKLNPLRNQTIIWTSEPFKVAR